MAVCRLGLGIWFSGRNKLTTAHTMSQSSNYHCQTAFYHILPGMDLLEGCRGKGVHPLA